MSVVRFLFCFISKCILFFILRDIVINIYIKGLIFLFPAVRNCFGHSQYLHTALVSDLLRKSYSNVILCVCVF